MNLSRCLRALVYQHSNITSITGNFTKPDVAKLAGRTRCFFTAVKLASSEEFSQISWHIRLGRKRWRASCFLRSGAAGHCRCLLDPRVSFEDVCERNDGNFSRWSKERQFGRRGSWIVSPPRVCSTRHGWCQDTGQSALKRHVEGSRAVFRTWAR